MFRTIGLLAALAFYAGTVTAAGAATAAPSPTPAPDPAMLARAKTWFAELQSGKIDRSQLTPQMNAALTPGQVSSTEATIGKLGTPATFAQEQTMSQGGYNYAVYLVTFSDGTKLNFVFAVDGSGNVAGLRLTNAP
ncbi:MAG: hypothetical protein WA814_08785 [Candidatus Baltobacteraceae bacterium]